MKMIIQRVSSASVEIDGETVGSIGKGLFVLIGVNADDTEAVADRMLKKLLGLRIFADAEGKTNLSLADVGGSLLLVSQFTLYADCRKGNRPSFVKAGPPEHAEALYDYLIGRARALIAETGSSKETDPAQGSRVETGRFGAEMKCSLVNDGPFTIDLDSDELTRQ